MKKNRPGKIITGVRLRPDRADKLREKAIELTIKRQQIIKETDIVNYLIDECLDSVDIDDLGLKINQDLLEE